jgi:hypothetical protein
VQNGVKKKTPGVLRQPGAFRRGKALWNPHEAVILNSYGEHSSPALTSAHILSESSMLRGALPLAPRSPGSELSYSNIEFAAILQQ